MKIAIAYYSKHHENTKKLLDAISKKYPVTLIDVTQTDFFDLSEFDAVGFASGIYFQKFAKQLLKFAEDNLPENKRVFFLYTYGLPQKRYTAAIEKITTAKNANSFGSYGCRGYDTFGPFKLLGGIAKGHPNDEEIEGAVAFYDRLAKDETRLFFDPARK